MEPVILTSDNVHQCWHDRSSAPLLLRSQLHGRPNQWPSNTFFLHKLFYNEALVSGDEYAQHRLSYYVASIYLLLVWQFAFYKRAQAARNWRGQA